MPLLRDRRRLLRCFYCGNKARNDQPGIPKTWSCPHCEATNNFDEHGEPVSPDVSQVNSTRPAVRYAQRPASPPIMPAPTQSLFCDNCLRNQMIVKEALAEYIPEPEHPDYQLYLDSADDKKRELEETYPQVCVHCGPRVQAQIDAAGYEAHADNLRYILARSEENRMRLFTRRQNWLLRLIFTAKWVYMLSTLVGLLWHTVGIIAEPTEIESPVFGTRAHGSLFLTTCLEQAFYVREVDSTCFESKPILDVVFWALIADAATFWWNPKLERKIHSQNARMRGTASLWLCRLFVTGFRVMSYIYPRGPPGEDALLSSYIWHAIVLGLIVLVTIMSWNVVRLEYSSLRSFKRSLQPLATQRGTSTSPRQNKPLRPNSTAFDTMGQSFTQSFNDDFSSDDVMAIEDPPSPTDSTTTSASVYSDVYTPVNRKKTTMFDDDAMDWTPTQRRFGQQTTTHPNPFGKPVSTESIPTPRQPHSLFAPRDPNPFAHKVPAFPKGPQAQKRDPWKPGIWNPAPPENKRTFLGEMMKQGDGGPTQEQRAQVTEGGVPRNVRREEAMFRQPQFKYDYQGYTGEKTTGLEDTFNDLFSK